MNLMDSYGIFCFYCFAAADSYNGDGEIQRPLLRATRTMDTMDIMDTMDLSGCVSDVFLVPGDIWRLCGIDVDAFNVCTF